MFTYGQNFAKLAKKSKRLALSFLKFVKLFRFLWNLSKVKKKPQKRTKTINNPTSVKR